MANYFEEFDRQVDDELGINEGRLNRWVEHRVTAALKQADVFHEYEKRKLRDVLDKAKEEHARLLEVVEFYANYYDQGKKARDALEGK